MRRHAITVAKLGIWLVTVLIVPFVISVTFQDMLLDNVQRGACLMTEVLQEVHQDSMTSYAGHVTSQDISVGTAQTSSFAITVVGVGIWHMNAPLVGWCLVTCAGVDAEFLFSSLELFA